MVQPISLGENTDGGGVFNWIKDNILSWLLPGGMAALAGGWISEQMGNSIPSWARPVTDTLANVWNGLLRVIRGIFNKEGLNADSGMSARVNNNAAFDQASAAVGGTPDQQRALARELRDVTTRRIASDTGLFMSHDPAFATTESIALRDSLVTRMVDAWKDRNPNWTPAARDAFTTRAQGIAGVIAGTGSSEAGDVNANTANGYLGLLVQVQRGVAAQGEYQASEVPQLNIPADALAAAISAAGPAAAPVPAPTGATPAPAPAPAPSAAR